MIISHRITQRSIRGPRLQAIHSGQTQLVVKMADGSVRYGNQFWLDNFEQTPEAEGSDLVAICWADGTTDEFS